ncbi:MAG TPA: hypothetical protein VHB01_00525 [Nitrosospira sp.]|nr:hypothetical protein [Nitrosospira sp.]
MFDFGLPIDMTPVSNSPHYQEYHDRGRTPLSDGKHRLSPTHVVSEISPIGRFTISSTRIESEPLQEQQKLIVDDTEEFYPPYLEEARDSRIALLVKKYEGATASTSEDSARFDILTERLRRLSPRSGPNDLEVLTGMMDQIERVTADLINLRNEYKK